MAVTATSPERKNDTRGRVEKIDVNACVLAYGERTFTKAKFRKTRSASNGKLHESRGFVSVANFRVLRDGLFCRKRSSLGATVYYGRWFVAPVVENVPRTTIGFFTVPVKNNENLARARTREVQNDSTVRNYYVTRTKRIVKKRIDRNA